MEVLNETEGSLRRIIPKSFKYSVLISIIIILSLAPVVGSFCERVEGEEIYSNEFYSSEAPENLEVEHNGTAGEKILHPDEEIESVNLEGEIGYLQYDPKSEEANDDWYEAKDHQVKTELKVAMDTPDHELDGMQTIGVLLRRTDTGEDIDSDVRIDLYQDGELIDTLANRLEINDPEGEVHYFDFDAADLDDSSGKYITLDFIGYHSGGVPAGRNTIEYGAVEWKVTTLGGRDNLITWNASPDDPYDVTQYNVSRSEEKNAEYDNIATVDADGSPEYEFIDADAGTADDILWWYKVHALDDQNQESERVGPEREPGPLAPTDPQPEDGARGVGPEEVELSVYVEHSDEETTDNVTFYHVSEDAVIGTDEDVEHGTRTADVTWDGLEEDQTYEWYVEVQGAGGSVTSEIWSFKTYSEDPIVKTLEAQNVTNDSAKLRGEVTSLGDNDQVEVYFRWRVYDETEWTDTDQQTISTEEDFEEMIDDLDGETEYEFKAVIEWENEGVGEVRTFTTLNEEATLADEWFFAGWWPYIILGVAAFAVIIGGGLYKKHSVREEPVIEEVFLISQRNSMLILHNTRRLKPNRDSDIIAGMFESVQKFIQDSFQDTEDWELNKMEFGDNKVVVERGDYVYVAVVYEGELSEENIQEIRDVIERIEDEFGEQLKEWDGDRKELRGIKDMTQDLFS